MSGLTGTPNRNPITQTCALAAMVVLITVAASSPAGATAKLWLYPDGDDPRSGGHVVTEPAFTLNVENRGTGGGDNTAYQAFLLVAVNDSALVVSGALTLPGGTVNLEPEMWTQGTPTFDCSGKGIPPHSIYPAYFAQIALGDIEQDEILSIGVLIDGAEGLRVHFDAKAVGERQTGPNTKCYDVLNPSGHDVTMLFDEPGGPVCHELFIDKSAGATGVALGDAMDYTIVVENRGTCELTEVLLSEDLPTVPAPPGQPVPAFTVTSILPPPTIQTPTSIEWNLGTLAPGDVVTATVSVVFDQPAAEGLEIENTACVSSFEITEPECSSASVTVEAGEDDEIGGPGFWCNQLRFAREGRPNAKFTIPELEGWLAEILDRSAVFPELWPFLVTLLDAETLLCRPNQLDTMADRVARHLLATWFNIVSERLPIETVLEDLCPGEEEPPEGMDPAMTVELLVAAVEEDLLAGADDETLEFWLDVLDFVNNASLPGSPGCGDQFVRGSGKGRHGSYRP